MGQDVTLAKHCNIGSQVKYDCKHENYETYWTCAIYRGVFPCFSGVSVFVFVLTQKTWECNFVDLVRPRQEIHAVANSSQEKFSQRYKKSFPVFCRVVLQSFIKLENDIFGIRVFVFVFVYSHVSETWECNFAEPVFLLQCIGKRLSVYSQQW